MLYGLILQAARPLSGDAVLVHQAIVVPAAKKTFTRTISTEHPRRQWKQGHFALDNAVWDHAGVRAAMRGDFAERRTALWHLTTDVPVLFPILDAEYRQMVKGDLPRNVALRAQRALDAHDAVLIGVDAHALTEVLDRLDAKIAAEDCTIAKAPGGRGRTKDRVNAILERLDESIRENCTGMLDKYVPNMARAKRNEPHRNHDNLPTVTDEPAVAPPVVVAPAAPVAEGAVVKPGDVVLQPNGDPYYARAMDIGIKGMSDVQFFREVGARGGHILIAGQPGTGKTAGLTAAFNGVVTLVCTPETEADDLYGGYVALNDPETGRERLEWTDGPLIRAMEAGKPLYLDEIFLTPGNQLSPLFPLMDGRGVIERIAMNPARGRIEAKPGFMIIASYNPDSARHINEALLSRFTVKLSHSTDWDLLRRLGVSTRAVDFGEHLEKQRLNGEAGWSPQFRELMRFKADEEAFGTLFAIMNMLSNVPEAELDLITGHARERWGDLPNAGKVIKALGV